MTSTTCGCAGSASEPGGHYAVLSGEGKAPPHRAELGLLGHTMAQAARSPFPIGPERVLALQC